MKFNFKKIASVIAGTVMMSSTLAFAAAANMYPAPFVKNGNADVAVVYGSMPGAEFDLLAVSDVTTSLQAKLASQTATTGNSVTSGSSVSGGDYVKIEKSNDKFNLMDTISGLYTTLDSEDFSKVLADGLYMNDQNEEFEYEQTITPAALQLTHFTDSDYNDEKPVVGFDLTAGQNIFNYTLEFTPDSAEAGTGFNDLENTDLQMLGKSFFVSQVVNQTTGLKITLLDAANTISLAEGETKTITVGDKTYEVSIVFVEDDTTDKVKLKINDETTNTITEGSTFKLKDGAYVGVKDVSYNGKDTGVSSAEISIGMGKIELDNDQEVQINDEAISDLEDSNEYSSVVTAHIDITGTDVEKIVLSWDLDDDAWIAPGTELVMPGFNTVKLSMGSFTAPKAEETILKDSSDSLSLSTTITQGDVDLSLLYSNSTKTGFAGLGARDNHRLVTNATASPSFNLNETQNSYFVMSWVSGDDYETYAFEIDGIDNANKTTLKNLASGGNDVVFSDESDTADVGGITLSIKSNSLNEATGVLTVKATPSSSGTVSGNLLYSKEGLQMRLPISVVNKTAVDMTDGEVQFVSGNATATPTPTWTMNFTEEDNDGNIGDGEGFSATFDVDSDGVEAGSVDNDVSSATGSMFEIEDGSDIDVGYVPSDLATKILFNQPDDGSSTLTITYAGDESFADVYVSEVGASIATTEGTVTTSSSGTVKELGNVNLLDTQVSQASTKNLVVVGGSCVNKVAADLLSGAGCGSSWESATGVAAGSFLIQTFERTGGKVATLVAGYNAEDTRNAAKVLISDATLDLTAGKKYKSTSATTVQMVTTAASTAATNTTA